MDPHDPVWEVSLMDGMVRCKVCGASHPEANGGGDDA